MKKIAFFVVVFFIFLSVVKAKRVNYYYQENEVRVRIIFTERIATTRNLDEKLSFIPYKLLSSKVKAHLSYVDENILKNINNINSSSLEETEKAYQKVLERFSLDSDLEKKELFGVFLSEVVIITNEKNLNYLDKEYKLVIF